MKKKWIMPAIFLAATAAGVYYLMKSAEERGKVEGVKFGAGGFKTAAEELGQKIGSAVTPVKMSFY